MHYVTLDDAKEQLPALIEAVARGEQVFITTADQTVVELVLAAVPHGVPTFGSARGLVTVPDDFDDPLPEFAPYTR